jgi:hypothetical protein
MIMVPLQRVLNGSVSAVLPTRPWKRTANCSKTKSMKQKRWANGLTKAGTPVCLHVVCGWTERIHLLLATSACRCTTVAAKKLLDCLTDCIVLVRSSSRSTINYLKNSIEAIRRERLVGSSWLKDTPLLPPAAALLIDVSYCQESVLVFVLDEEELLSFLPTAAVSWHHSLQSSPPIQVLLREIVLVVYLDSCSTRPC